MTTSRLLLTAWDFDPSVIGGCALLLGIYFRRVREASAARRFSYVLGVLMLFLSIESPIDPLGETYLFSAHMAQHLVMILIVPPLLLWGIPEAEARSWLRHPRIAMIEGILGKPIVAWLSCIGLMTLWHWPALYNLALGNQTIHIFQHLTFLVSGTMFWWPVMSPIPERRMSSMAAILYLFAAVAENSALGIALTFIRPGHYGSYTHPADPLGALSLIRNQWGMTAVADQRLGGLLMWIPGCSVYFVAILLLVVEWYDRDDTEPAEEPLTEGTAR